LEPIRERIYIEGDFKQCRCNEGQDVPGQTVCGASQHFQHIPQLIGYHPSQPGLSNVPTPLIHLREEVGLSGAPWESLGAEWHSLAALWLRTETALSLRSGRTDLSFADIHKSSIPEAWKEWMNAKIMKTDTQRPSDSFGKELANYLSGLPSTAFDIGGTIQAGIWCRPGKTGILGLLLCLYWQAEYSGSGNNWKANTKRVECIFNAILAEPTL
jgi:hypothetical protein